MTDDPLTNGPPSRESLEARARAIKGAIGVASAVFVGPLCVFALFVALNWLEPRALGTYSFLVGAPLLLALFAARAPHSGFLKSFALTMAGVCSLAAILYLARLESVLCLLVLLSPVVMILSLFQVVFRLSRLSKLRTLLRQSKNAAPALLLVTIGLASIERYFGESASSREVALSVIVSASPSTIWSGITEVPAFSEDELPSTWMQTLGVPRPVRATFEAGDGKRIRVGYFETGLRFREDVTTFLDNQELGLSVAVDDDSLNANDVARHAFAKGFFEIDDVRYRIHPTGRTTVLSLSCRYTVHTSVTPYAHVVAGIIIKNFERNLLAALAARFEHRMPLGGKLLLAERR